MFSGANLSTKQAKLLEQLPDFGSRTIVPKKMYSTSDLAALTAQTGDEFAMFTTGGRRLIVRGNPRSVPINTSAAEQLANQGWRWSAHSHPGISQTVLTASGGDRAVLSQFINQAKSRIFNSVGRSQPFGKDFSDWLPGQ